jgi:hypothetical protein
VASDPARLREILIELERLATTDQLTTMRFFELAREATVAAGEDELLLEKIADYGTKLSPDWQQLRRAASEVTRLGELGALTPARFEALYEQARMAVGDRTELLEPFPEFRGRQ